MASALTDNEVRMVNLIEQRFYETGHVPTNEKLALDLKLSKQLVIKAWKKEVFRQALLVRGVNLDSEGNTSDILSQEQLLVANMILNVHDKTTIRKKLEAVSTALGKKITVQTYNGWLQQPAFQNYLRKRVEKEFGNTDTEAKMAHIKAIHDGDMNAVKLYYEMTGLYNPKVQVDVNIESVIVQVVEIITRHVSDPVALEAIASEIEQLDIGRPTPKMVETTSRVMESLSAF